MTRPWIIAGVAVDTPIVKLEPAQEKAGRITEGLGVRTASGINIQKNRVKSRTLSTVRPLVAGVILSAYDTSAWETKPFIVETLGA